MKTDLFQSCGHCWVFQICWCIECSTFTASSFRIWNSSAGIPSPPLALFVMMLSKAHLTSHSRMSGLKGYFCLKCIFTSCEKAMAPHSITLAWKIPWTKEPGRLQSMGSLRVGHDWATSLSLFTFMRWRRKLQPTPVSLPGESQGRGSLVGCRLRGHTVGHDWNDLAAAAAWLLWHVCSLHCILYIVSLHFLPKSLSLTPVNKVSNNITLL